MLVYCLPHKDKSTQCLVSIIYGNVHLVRLQQDETFLAVYFPLEQDICFTLELNLIWKNVSVYEDACSPLCSTTSRVGFSVKGPMSLFLDALCVVVSRKHIEKFNFLNFQYGGLNKGGPPILFTQAQCLHMVVAVPGMATQTH